MRIAMKAVSRGGLVYTYCSDPAARWFLALLPLGYPLGFILAYPLFVSAVSSLGLFVTIIMITILSAPPYLFLMRVVHVGYGFVEDRVWLHGLLSSRDVHRSEVNWVELGLPVESATTEVKWWEGRLVPVKIHIQGGGQWLSIRCPPF